VPKVLVVDDALADRALVTGLISKRMEGTILEAADGKEALAQIEANQPDIVLTDLRMPEMNGLELVTAVKESFPRIPVVLMTADGSEEIAAQALQHGAASYVPKRRLACDLLNTMQQVLAASRGERSKSELMHYMSRTETTFVLHNDLDLIQLLVDQLLNMLRCLPLGDETSRLRVGIALVEAMENAYYHGNLEVSSEAGDERSRYFEVAARRRLEVPYGNRRIHVSAQISRDEAVFVVRDDGAGFDAPKHLGIDASLADADAAGRGIILMKSIMDEIHYNDTGNELTLVKRRYQEDDEFEDADDFDDEESDE